MGTRIIKRLADSAEIYVIQKGDVVVNGQGVLRRAEDKKMLDGLYTDPYGAFRLLASGRAVVLEED